MTWAWVRDNCYTLARGWDMQPSEFWSLTIHDFWIEFDMRVRLGKRLKEVTGGGSNVADDIEWARKLHREKKARAAAAKAAAT